MEKSAWTHAKQVFNDALGETGPERVKLVEEACGDDSEILDVVLALLKAHDEAGDFLSEAALDCPLPGSKALLDHADFAQFPGIDRDGPEDRPDGLARKDPPARIGPYEVLGVLGAGGMGTVYRARDPDLSRELAVKVLPDDLVSPKQLARFDREAKLLASLNHPNIATIHAIGDADGRPYLVLELIEGESLSQKLAGGPLPLEEAVDLGRQVAEAIGAAHEAGIVHRDLKPANVMITSRGLVKILDFGIAKARGSGLLAPERMEITGDGTLVGTIPYLSPEQVLGEEVDERSDLWALGCLLFEVLTGRSPFERPTTASTLVAIQKETPDLASIPSGTPEALSGLISDCLEKDPNRRPASAEVVRMFLSDTLTGLRGLPAGSLATRTPLGRAVWIAVGSFVTVLVLAVAEGSIVGVIIEWLPQDVRLAVTDGGRLAAAAAAVLVALLFGLRFMAGMNPTQLRRRIKTASLGLAGITGLALLYLLGSRIEALPGVFGFPTADVYVSLPFEGIDNEGDDDEGLRELLSLSNSFRSTFATVFDGIESVQILPDVYDFPTLKANLPLCTFQRAEVWSSGSGRAPNLVLCPTVNVTLDAAGGTGLIVVSDLTRARDKKLDRVDKFKAIGREDEIRYLALSISAEIVRTLHRYEDLRLGPDDEEIVLDRVLDRFLTFLSSRPDPPLELEQAVEELLEARQREENPTVQDVMDVLGRYESVFDPVQGEEQDQRSREATLRRVGGTQ